MRLVNRFLSLLLLLACSFVGRAASPAYNTSTGVVSPTQFLKLDAAELKVMGVDVLTTAPNIYTTDGTLGGDRTVNGGGNSLTFDNIDYVRVNNIVSSGDPLGVDYAVVHYDPDSDETHFRASITIGGDVWGTYLSQYIDNGTNIAQILALNRNAQTLTLLDPSSFSGSANYIFGTHATKSSGNLVEVPNNGTNVFTIDYLGNITANNINIPGDQTANNLTITNVLTVKGSIRADTLIVTNNVTFYNNTYVSNFFSTSATVTNDLAVLDDATIGDDLAVTGDITQNGNLVATYAGITNTLTFALSDMTTALTTGTNKNYWYAPAEGMTIKWVRATVAQASTSGTPTFDLNENGTSVLSTKVTIDQDEWDSLNAATPPVISDATIAGKAKLDMDIDVAGTASAGAQFQIGYTVP